MNEQMPFQSQTGGYQALPLAARLKALHLALGMFFRALRRARRFGLTQQAAAMSANQFARAITTMDLQAELSLAYEQAMRENGRQRTRRRAIPVPKL